MRSAGSLTFSGRSALIFMGFHAPSRTSRIRSIEFTTVLNLGQLLVARPPSDLPRLCSQRQPDLGGFMTAVTLDQLLRRQVAARGGKTALTSAGEALSYADIDRRAAQVAHGLIARG